VQGSGVALPGVTLVERVTVWECHPIRGRTGADTLDRSDV